MGINKPKKEEILAQIKYLEKNIFNGSSVYRTNRLSRLRALKSRLLLK
ncbi:MAG: hypothetical protein WCR12_04290 [Dysgonamonadaceae bacterium]|jgi:hypothetical protein|nr:hypothetical protein [Dysgonamonadaceae bacterium]MDD3308339.1 hypothetical protein [Dysgonamonadaceae bacterium]MDD3900278.1 hypothetical protein [Dysgonamonadaceae bacterium]MDD4398834.1 hypothetical protein [Dysgonamonadaceae bacterium]MEA5082196.1 hypothetical protein [Dysgonamonadaceae bacterium]